MSFDYYSQTKQAYNQPSIAREYHAAFSGPLTWKTLRSRCVAAREKKIVSRFLQDLQVHTLLDLPCGTGKLAPVFAQGAYDIQAADISVEMMEIARESYARAGLNQATFSICDAEEITQHFAPGSVDVAVCLRLMHRVPVAQRLTILRQLSLTAREVIISYAVDAPFHRLRRRLRNLLFGVTQQVICAATFEAIHAELSRDFRVLRSRWVAYLLSEEAVFLLESKSARNPQDPFRSVQKPANTNNTELPSGGIAPHFFPH